jgi:aminoglycoside phosphotransferase (APT) family kinase protein
MNKNNQKQELLKKYLNKIKNKFPEVSWRLSKIITNGCDNDVIILDSRYVFRFPKNKDAKIKLVKEVEILQKLNTFIKLRIPRIEFISSDFSFIGYLLIVGRPIQPQKIYGKLSNDQLLDFNKKLVAFLKELHSENITKDLKQYFLNQPKNKELRDLKKDVKKYLLRILNEKDIATINEFFIEYKKAFSVNYEKVIIHGDLSWEHLLFRNNILSGAIDFSDLSYGDPAVDFSCFWDYGEKFVKTICKLYDSKKDKSIYSRSKLHYKKIAIILMIESQRGDLFSFKDSYAMFKERF